ncbi:MAG: GNAT family N-acetyltransferase [Candidatus Saccharimonadales bacterium]
MFQLRDRLPEKSASRYWSHSSGGEHVGKQEGDLSEIDALRKSRGLAQIQGSTMERSMYSHGVIAVRQNLHYGGVGRIVGYGVVDRSSREGRVALLDLWVAEGHRKKGIGGYILGKLLTNRPYTDPSHTKQSYGKTLAHEDTEYLLPNMQVSLFLPSPQVGVDFKAKMPSDWTGILSLEYKDGSKEEQVLYQAGAPSHTFVNRKGRFLIDGDPTKRRYDNVAIAAIVALNQET